jgi:hypothetical protein
MTLMSVDNNESQDPRSRPRWSANALASVVPSSVVPVLPIVEAGSEPYAMAGEFRRYPWVLPPVVYSDAEELLENIDPLIVAPLEAKARELREMTP